MAVDHMNLAMSIDELMSMVRRQTLATIQNASIGHAGLRVYDGGKIVIENGGLDITGTANVDGYLNVSGNLSGTGTFEWSGPMHFTGNASLSGTMDVTGNIRVLAGGKISVGNLVIDPSSHGGMITLPNGGQVLANGNAIEVWSPGPVRRGWTLSPTAGIHIFGADTATTTAGKNWLAVDTAGKVYSVSPSIGGPGGQLAWPFPASTVSSEYGPRESPTPGGSTFHEGIDFGIGEGTPIPAAGSGTVVLAGWNGGYGNCVIIDHGGGLRTLYGHMRDTPSVTVDSHVARGQTIGLVGTTGVSSGPHLHLEVHVNGTTVNPRTKLPPA